MMKVAVLFALVVSALGVGCGGGTSPSSTPSTIAELFPGTLDVNGSVQYGFTVATAGAVSVTLASVTSGALGEPAGKTLTVGIGDIPSETVCTVTTSSTVGAALTTQITATMTIGPHCVQISDPGTLSGPVKFVVRIVHP